MPFFLSHQTALSYSPYNYAIQQLALFAIVYSLKGFSKNAFLLSPSFIAVSYINLNFLIGSIVFNKGLVFNVLKPPYESWGNAHLVLGYFNLANFAIILSFFLVKKFSFSYKTKTICDLRRFSSGFMYLFGIVTVLFFTLVDLKLGFIGGDGSFSEVPKTIGALIIVVTIFKNQNLKKRILLYFLLLLCFSIISWEDKRDAIFLLLPIILLESTKFKLNLGFKKIILFCASVCAILYLIIVMSITRGYGQYDVDNFIDATSYVEDYVTGDYFVHSLMNNLEISYTYLHSNNAVEKILEKPDLKTYGETLIKPIFMFIPRSVMESKPRSIIHHYTNGFSEDYRDEGGSWTISFQSEMFWNFAFFGIFIGILFFYVFNLFYKYIIELVNTDNIINYIPLLYFYKALLILFRGSGMDMFIIFMIITVVIFIVFKIGLRITYDIIKKR